MRSARWWLRRVALALGVCLLLGYGAVRAVLYVKQRSLIYFPHTHSPLGQSNTQMLQVDGTPVYFAYRELAGTKAVLTADALAQVWRRRWQASTRLPDWY